MPDSRTKPLNQLSLEELWQLFPVELSPYNYKWAVWAASEICDIARRIQSFMPRINHIGSTAVPGICAKPIVDILVEVSPHIDLTAVGSIIESLGYTCMSTSDTRMSFNKGYTPEGYADKVFHLHLRHYGDNDEILFRDYLILHPEAAKEYEALKRSLLPRFRHDRDAYTAAKSPFIHRILTLAKGSQEEV